MHLHNIGAMDLAEGAQVEAVVRGRREIEPFRRDEEGAQLPIITVEKVEEASDASVDADPFWVDDVVDDNDAARDELRRCPAKVCRHAWARMQWVTERGSEKGCCAGHPA